MNQRSLLLQLLFLLAAASTAAAQSAGWTRAADGYYVRIGLSSLTAAEQYGFDGESVGLFADTSSFRSGEFGVTDIGFYGELGFTDWLTGIASTQYTVAVREAQYVPTGRDSTASAS